MREQFLEHTMDLMETPADFFSGNRKILCNRSIVFDGPLLDDFDISDCGFTKSKLTILRKGYVVQEAIDAAVMLWELRKEKAKYGSVAFHCYGHLLKNDPNKTSKRGSTMGPCIQAVILTWIPGRNRKCDGWTDIAVYYRTTEWFKKFPADLVLLRDELLPNFDFTGVPIRKITFHFANMTIHPMYLANILPLIKRPIGLFKSLEKVDPHFHDWCVKWTSRYLCDEYGHGIEKFEQAKRVRADILRRLDPATITKLQKYIRANHSGFRGAKK